jgi:hypothetical protein
MDGWGWIRIQKALLLLAGITMGCKASRVCVCTCERENRGVLRFRQRDTFFLVVLLASIMASHEASSIHALFYSTKHKKNILLSRNYYSIYYYCLV